MRKTAEQGGGLSYYDFGRTTVFAHSSDPRFSYTLYVPSDYEESSSARYRLIVIVHGTERNFIAYRDHFVPLAEARDCVILAPLFPAGVCGPRDLSSYKLLRGSGVDYDEILLAMIDEIGEKYRLDAERFCLYGFSGGGHFAHRFFFAHPERLRGVSIGAPGVVTLLDRNHDYWVGVRNFEEIFGRAVDVERMRQVPVHAVIGSEDTETWEITIEPGNAWYMEGAALAGPDRQARMKSLLDSLEREGVRVQKEVIPGAAHEAEAMVASVSSFFEAVLESS